MEEAPENGKESSHSANATVSDQVSHPLTTVGKIILLYIIILYFLKAN